MSFIDTAVVIIVVIFFIAVIYKAMPEPINWVFSIIGRAFGFVGEKTVGAAAGAGETIAYG
jgi:hypothetical protein